MKKEEEGSRVLTVTNRRKGGSLFLFLTRREQKMEDLKYDEILSYLRWKTIPVWVKSTQRGNFQEKMKRYQLHTELKSTATIETRIMVKLRNGRGGTKDVWRYLPRRSQLKEILEEYHVVSNKQRGSNHVGRDKMLVTVFEKYWWPDGARDDIQQFINCCEECSRSTPSMFKPPLQSIVAKHRRERCQFDLTEFPQDPTTGDRWLLNIINCHTKYGWGFPLKNKKVSGGVD